MKINNYGPWCRKLYRVLEEVIRKKTGSNISNDKRFNPFPNINQSLFMPVNPRQSPEDDPVGSSQIRLSREADVGVRLSESASGMTCAKIRKLYARKVFSLRKGTVTKIYAVSCN